MSPQISLIAEELVLLLFATVSVFAVLVKRSAVERRMVTLVYAFAEHIQSIPLYLVAFVEYAKPKNASILAILSTKRSGKGPAGLSESRTGSRQPMQPSPPRPFSASS
jgi:hypothetical protein